ncbi:hypothetical protein, partial [Paracidovorax cattleyae]|uniref:hypothetical protein n=1 Tax=Paracidovorax cattleyae TaxID=80868 RepID=UPI001E560595
MRPGRKQGACSVFQRGAGVRVGGEPGFLDGFGVAGIAARRRQARRDSGQLALRADRVQQIFHPWADTGQFLVERRVDIQDGGRQVCQRFVRPQTAGLAQSGCGFFVHPAFACRSSAGWYLPQQEQSLQGFFLRAQAAGHGLQLPELLVERVGACLGQQHFACGQRGLMVLRCGFPGVCGGLDMPQGLLYLHEAAGPMVVRGQQGLGNFLSGRQRAALGSPGHFRGLGHHGIQGLGCVRVGQCIRDIRDPCPARGLDRAIIHDDIEAGLGIRVRVPAGVRVLVHPCVLR